MTRNKFRQIIDDTGTYGHGYDIALFEECFQLPDV